MKHHLKTGKEGETLAAEWLVAGGYAILFRNWRYAYYEIDLIAIKQDVLHFIEVKTRKNNRFGYPEEAVDRKKLQRLMHAAEVFLSQYPRYKRVQYDVVSVQWFPQQTPQIMLFEDVYPW
ncbi:MAG: YraN family protein [Chitinophagaceae bacterium]